MAKTGTQDHQPGNMNTLAGAYGVQFKRVTRSEFKNTTLSYISRISMETIDPWSRTGYLISHGTDFVLRRRGSRQHHPNNQAH